MPVARKLVAVVAADVVAYSRLMERDEAGTNARIRKLRERLIDPKVAEHGGRTRPQDCRESHVDRAT